MDYKQIIEELSCEQVEKILDKLDVSWVDKGEYLLCKTACHNIDLEEASWKLYYYKNTHYFYCYTSCASMSIFRFLEHYYETRAIPYDWHEDVLNFVISYNENYFKENSNLVVKYTPQREKFEQKKNRRQLPIYPNGIINAFVKRYPVEWIQEGISVKAMEKYHIRFSEVQNKIIIPHYNVNGELVGIRGRALDKWEIENVGKYLPVQVEGKWYSHPLSLNLYGLFENKENIKKYGICYVYEAEKSILLSESFSFPNCGVAVCGSQFNKYQVDLLLRHCQPKEIVLCFDNEEKEKEDKYFNKLMGICKKYNNYCNFSFIYDRKNLTKKKDSPVDRGEEIFRELVKERVKVK